MGLPARKLSPDADQRIAEVTLSLDGKRIIFVLESGAGYSIPRPHLPGDDGTPVTGIEIFDHQHAVAIRQASGAVYEVPWDSIQHYARGRRQRKIMVGRRLRALRQQHHWQQAELARAVGLSRQQLIRIERDRSRPSMETFLDLCRTLGVSPKDLLGQ